MTPLKSRRLVLLPSTVKLLNSQIWRHLFQMVKLGITSHYFALKMNHLILWINLLPLTVFILEIQMSYHRNAKIVDQDCKVFRVSSCRIDFLVTFHVCAQFTLHWPGSHEKQMECTSYCCCCYCQVNSPELISCLSQRVLPHFSTI